MPGQDPAAGTRAGVGRAHMLVTRSYLTEGVSVEMEERARARFAARSERLERALRR